MLPPNREFVWTMLVWSGDPGEAYGFVVRAKVVAWQEAYFIVANLEGLLRMLYRRPLPLRPPLLRSPAGIMRLSRQRRRSGHLRRVGEPPGQATARHGHRPWQREPLRV